MSRFRINIASFYPTALPSLQNPFLVSVPTISDLNHPNQRRFDAVNDPVIADPQTPIGLQPATQRLAVIFGRPGQARLDGGPDAVPDVPVEGGNIIPENQWMVDDSIHVLLPNLVVRLPASFRRLHALIGQRGKPQILDILAGLANKVPGGH